MRSVQVMFPLSASGGGEAGALVYKGTVASASDLPASPSLGWVYVATASFTVSSKSVESGDMLIWNGTGWDIVQGNIDPVDIWEVVYLGGNVGANNTYWHKLKIYKNGVRQTSGNIKCLFNELGKEGQGTLSPLYTTLTYSSMSGYWMGQASMPQDITAEFECFLEVDGHSVLRFTILKPANGITSTDDGYARASQVYQIVGDVETLLAAI